MMNKMIDWALGLPGLVLVLIVAFTGVVLTPSEHNPKTDCEARGGQWTQTMKSYHECKMPRA